MNINKFFLSVVCMFSLLMMGVAEAMNTVSNLSCNKADYSCCRVAYGALNPTLKEKLYKGNLTFVKGSGCPTIFYPDGGRPKFLFLQSSKCSIIETPIVLKPSSQTESWQFKLVPSNCINHQG